MSSPTVNGVVSLDNTADNEIENQVNEDSTRKEGSGSSDDNRSGSEQDLKEDSSIT